MARMKDGAGAVALACRVLAYQGQDHFCYGHVSIRCGTRIAIKAAGVSLAHMTEQTVAFLDADGTNTTPERRVHDETALHLAVYQARPDVGAVVHTHSEAAQAATMHEVPSSVFSQDGAPFAGSLARYSSAALVNTPARAATFAACLGPCRGALLSNHGIVTVGRDVAEAGALALVLDRALRVWLLAAAVGRPVPIDDDEATDLAAAFERSHHTRMADIWADAQAILGP